MSDRPVLKRKSARGRKPGSKNRPKVECAPVQKPIIEPAAAQASTVRDDKPVDAEKPARAGRGSAGRKKAVLIEEQRERVKVLLAGGMKVSAIARVLGISEPTCRKRFAAEIRTGIDQKQAAVLEAMFLSALSGSVAAQKAFLELARLASAARDLLDRNHEEPQDAGATAASKMGKKEEAAELAKDAATGIYAVPAAPRMVVDNTR